MINSIIEKIEQQIGENGNIELEVENFICKDWRVHYNLFNPENFEDPENPPAWYDVSLVYTYDDNPIASEKIEIYSSAKIQTYQMLLNLFENTDTIEKKLLSAIIQYTFGNGGAYAEAKYYNYAKRTMELLHKVNFTNEEFIKRNLRLHTVELGSNHNELILRFDCSWNEEHGLAVYLKNNEIISFE
jgi:hypothetical protein